MGGLAQPAQVDTLAFWRFFDVGTKSVGAEWEGQKAGAELRRPRPN